MNVLSISQSNVLGDDVLLMIFEHLKGEDLVKCEAVCRPWRDILLTETPWRRLFHRKVNSSHLWRYEQKKLEKNQPTLRTEQYRNVCKNLLQVERNWCTGRFEKFVCSLDEIGGDHLWQSDMAISDDYVAWNVVDFENGGARSRCLFLDKESKEITKFPLVLGFQSFNEMEVRYADSTRSVVTVRDPKNQWTVKVGNAEQNGYGDNAYRRLIFGSGRLVEYTQPYNDGTERLRIWKMGNPAILLHDRRCENRNLIIKKVDEQFIVAIDYDGSTDNPYPDNARTFYFFSTETFQVFTSLSVNNCKWKYDRGLLFQYFGNPIVRILDVASGKHFNDVRIPVTPHRIFTDQWASSNSDVVVIGWKYKKKSGVLSHLSVYDLEAMKKPNSDPGSYLLYTLQFQFYINSFVMNDTLIALIGSHYTRKLETDEKQSMTVLNFANFNFDERKSSDLEENLEDNEDVKIRIVRDPFFHP